MRIADVAEFFAEAGGGVKTYLEAKLAAGARHGHEVVLIAPGAEDGEETRAGGRILWVKSPPVPGDPRYRLLVSRARVHAALDRVRPHLVEASSPYGGAHFAASWAPARARVLVFHQDPVAALAHPVLDRYLRPEQLDRAAAPIWAYLRRLGRRFDATVVAGAWLAERLTGFGLERVEAIPFGVDPRPFWSARRSTERVVELKAKLGLPPGGVALVAVSRHHPEKRLTTLIEAVRSIDPRRERPVGLVVYGDGPDRARVERAARGCGRIWVAGYTRNRAALAAGLAAADAFLHGSAAETFGLVVSEALAAGLPLVVPDAGGAREVADPRFAETYRAGDAAGCADAIRRLLDRDLSVLRPIAREAGSRVRTLDAHFAELFAHYARLVGR